jgi:phosphatidylserine decarboxylase
MKYLLLKLLPKNLTSKLMGKLADLQVPSPLLLSFIRVYSRLYEVNLKEIKLPLSGFKSFNEFFTRELVPEARSVDSDPKSITSPVDGKVAEFGPIKNQLLIQTKGIQYSLVDLVGKKHSITFDDGFFVTLYLSPSDYHRIHSPAAGKVHEFSYFSGNLWPVNAIGVANVGGLFSLNERVLTLLEGEYGKIAVIKVGATVVGKIKLDYSDLTSNSGNKTQLHLPVFPPKIYAKGQELGQFQLGSTVILLFEKNRFKPQNLQRDEKITMGQVMGFY